MYSRRQRSTRNAAVAATNANANARTTRGRTSKAKHPRRGGGNPDTARIRASIERPPVVPWVKVMRPPALHLRRTFLVEKWVKPSDLTEDERQVYELEQKKKEEERQRLLRLQQQKREEEEREKEKAEQEKREQEEKEKLQAAAAAQAALAQGGETVKPIDGQSIETTATKLGSGAPVTIASTPLTSVSDVATPKAEADKPEAASAGSSMELEQPQAPSQVTQVSAVEESSTPAVSTSTNDSAQALPAIAQDSIMESKPTTQSPPDASPPITATESLQEPKQTLPQNTKNESIETPPVNPSTVTSPPPTNPQAQVSQPQQEQGSSSTENIAASIEPQAKKPRIE